MSRGARWILFISVLVVLTVSAYAATKLIVWNQSHARFDQGTATLDIQRDIVNRFEGTRFEPGIAVLHDYLALTPAQRRAIGVASSELVKSRRTLRQRVWEARDNFVALMRDPNASKDDLLAALHQLTVARENMARNTVSYLFELRSYLTPAQRSRLAELVERGMCSLDGVSGTCGAPGGGACGLGILGNTRRGSRPGGGLR
ncbi:MAG: Spy/CpxP family protein refolding chaperone [Armatimonadota bacterium]